MQSVKFKTLDEFLDFLPPDELEMTEVLRKLVFDVVPDVREKLSFNVPYYHRNKGIFFIWPASVTWGSKKTYDGVRFGFQQGYLIPDELNHLDRGNRKLIYWRDFKSKSDIDIPLLERYLLEAVIVDDSFARPTPTVGR